LRLVRTLQEIGLVVQDPDTDNYRLDGTWISLRDQLRVRYLRSVALPILRNLTTETGETASLGFLFHDHIRVLEVVESTQSIRMSNHRDRILPPLCLFAGKGNRSPPDLCSCATSTRPESIRLPTYADAPAIHEELGKIRELGFAEDREETVVGGALFRGARARLERRSNRRDQRFSPGEPAE
jgi:DNA-binding IclR family transcriptional regulator